MSVISGTLQAEAARSAGNKQADAADAATQAQLRMYEEGRADTAPWREAGANALVDLVSRVKAGPGDFTKSPGYDFRIGEGNKAVERGAAARGGVLSGATQKALERYSQDYASNEYNNFLQQYYQSLTPYQSLAGIGQTTAMQNAASGNAVAGQIGQNMQTGANALAAGQINQANAYSGAINSGVNNYMLWKYMNNSSAMPATKAKTFADVLGSDEAATALEAL